MEFHVNFQYRPKDSLRPLDEQMLDISGEILEIIYQDNGAIPNIGDHVAFCYAGSKRIGSGPRDFESAIIQVQGVVENRLFFFFTKERVIVNIVVTDSEVNGGLLIKE